MEGGCPPLSGIISIHALREERDPAQNYRPFIGYISIHALREERDRPIPARGFQGW